MSWIELRWKALSGPPLPGSSLPINYSEVAFSSIFSLLSYSGPKRIDLALVKFLSSPSRQQDLEFSAAERKKVFFILYLKQSLSLMTSYEPSASETVFLSIIVSFSLNVLYLKTLNKSHCNTLCSIKETPPPPPIWVYSPIGPKKSSFFCANVFLSSLNYRLPTLFLKIYCINNDCYQK